MASSDQGLMSLKRPIFFLLLLIMMRSSLCHSTEPNSKPGGLISCLAASIHATAGQEKALQPDLSGISYFQNRDAYLKELKVAKGDGFTVDYYPRTDEYTVYDKTGATIATLNGRSGVTQIKNTSGPTKGL